MPTPPADHTLGIPADSIDLSVLDDPETLPLFHQQPFHAIGLARAFVQQAQHHSPALIDRLDEIDTPAAIALGTLIDVIYEDPQSSMLSFPPEGPQWIALAFASEYTCARKLSITDPSGGAGDAPKTVEAALAEISWALDLGRTQTIETVAMIALDDDGRPERITGVDVPMSVLTRELNPQATSLVEMPVLEVVDFIAQLSNQPTEGLVMHERSLASLLGGHVDPNVVTREESKRS